MKKLLYITAFPPGEKTAGQDYSRRLILDLLEKGHSVSLVYAEYPGHSVELPDSVQILHVISPSMKNCLAKPLFHLKNRRFEYSSADTLFKRTFCFYGAWNRPENAESLEWFLRHVYSLVIAENRYVVVGGGMGERLRRKLSSFKNISYLGFVDDPVAEISKCQALVAPLRKGAGVKVKVIDALSSGTPVIGTSVAFEGIGDNPCCPLFRRAETAAEFAAALNGWQFVSAGRKRRAADEFFGRYDTNHFADLLDDFLGK